MDAKQCIIDFMLTYVYNEFYIIRGKVYYSRRGTIQGGVTSRCVYTHVYTTTMCYTLSMYARIHLSYFAGYVCYGSTQIIEQNNGCITAKDGKQTCMYDSCIVTDTTNYCTCLGGNALPIQYHTVCCQCLLYHVTPKVKPCICVHCFTLFYTYDAGVVSLERCTLHTCAPRLCIHLSYVTVGNNRY